MTSARLLNRNRRLQVESLETRALLSVNITEFMASNNGAFVDEDGDASDWIELYNSGPDPVDLGGWSLTDDVGEPTKWTFPAQNLAVDSYLVVFASDKDRAASGAQLHTNFRLSRDGEYLALIRADGSTVESEFGSPTTGYPEQLTDVSYGPTMSGDPAVAGNFFMPTPTPGGPNQPGVLGFVDTPTFNVDRGFFSATDLEANGSLARGVAISAGENAPAATQILYTTDGSSPTVENPTATVYSGPIAVSTTTTLRAAAYADQYLPSNVETHTYLFAAHVLQQDGAGLPELTQLDYVMDPDVVNDTRFASLEADLQSLPTVSFVGNVEELFGADGILENPEQFGRDWEREVSVELINADGTDGFQENAGLRIQGAGSRARAFSKKSFQLFFRDDYGSAKLNFPFFGDDRSDAIDRIAFRGNFFDSWTFNQRGTVGGACCGYDQVLQLRDDFGRATHEAMGALTIGDQWVHLYLNGQYWGLYNATERPDEDFAEHYLGGDASDYDVLKQRLRGTSDGSAPEVVNGDLAAWDTLMSLVREDITTDEVYQQVAAAIDLEQFADYVLLNIFGGNFDWPHNNWYAVRERTDDARWTFVSWDVEHFLFSASSDRTEFSTNNSPGIIYSRLRRNDDFRLLFADRVHQHMFNDGALTVQQNLDRFNAIVDEIAAGMNAESARWGDANATPARNTIDTWLPEVEDKRVNYFPRRTATVLDQLLNDNLYTAIEAPEFYVDAAPQHGGELTVASQMQIVQPSAAFVDTILIGEGAAVEAYIPNVDEFADATWTEPSFATASDPIWSSNPIVGTTGIGFDGDGVYDPWINTNIAAMQDNSGSVLMRMEFSYDSALSFERLQLRMRYDDAFVAYLNGVEVARTSNIRTQFPPQAARARNHPAEEAFEVFDISSQKDLLVDGQNVLAIQGINVSRGSSDFLIVPMLVAGNADLSIINENIWFTTDGSDPRSATTGLPSPTAKQFAGPFSLAVGGPVKARALVDGDWSALSNATFLLPIAGDTNDDGSVNAADIDFLAAAIRSELDTPDLNQDGVLDFADMRFLVTNQIGTVFGDSNLDSVFNSTDLVAIFQTGEYEDAVAGNSTWADGDWNGDGDFNTGDLVLAFEQGGFTSAAVAEQAASPSDGTFDSLDRPAIRFAVQGAIQQTSQSPATQNAVASEKDNERQSTARLHDAVFSAVASRRRVQPRREFPIRLPHPSSSTLMNTDRWQVDGQPILASDLKYFEREN